MKKMNDVNLSLTQLWQTINLEMKEQTLQKFENLVCYSRLFSRLRVDRAHGIAPHKPILLLSVIELIKSGLIHQNQIYLSEELVTTFSEVWKYLGSETHKPDISRPFFHLRGDNFWHLIPNRGYRKIITSKVKLKTFTQVKQAIKYAYIDDALFELLQDPLSRDSLRVILVHKWFSHKLEAYHQYLDTISSQKLSCYSQKLHEERTLDVEGSQTLHQKIFQSSC